MVAAEPFAGQASGVDCLAANEFAMAAELAGSTQLLLFVQVDNLSFRLDRNEASPLLCSAERATLELDLLAEMNSGEED